MKTFKTHLIPWAHHLDCFSHFDLSDPICKKFCVLNIRCVIARNEKDQLEFHEDPEMPERISLRIH